MKPHIEITIVNCLRQCHNATSFNIFEDVDYVLINASLFRNEDDSSV